LLTDGRLLKADFRFMHLMILRKQQLRLLSWLIDHRKLVFEHREYITIITFQMENGQ